MGWRMRVFLVCYDLIHGLARRREGPNGWWRRVGTHAVVWAAERFA